MIRVSNIWQRLTRFSKPVVAAINGYCLAWRLRVAMHVGYFFIGRVVMPQFWPTRKLI